MCLLHTIAFAVVPVVLDCSQECTTCLSVYSCVSLALHWAACLAHCLQLLMLPMALEATQGQPHCCVTGLSAAQRHASSNTILCTAALTGVQGAPAAACVSILATASRGHAALCQRQLAARTRSTAAPAPSPSVTLPRAAAWPRRERGFRTALSGSLRPLHRR